MGGEHWERAPLLLCVFSSVVFLCSTLYTVQPQKWLTTRSTPWAQTGGASAVLSTRWPPDVRPSAHAKSAWSGRRWRRGCWRRRRSTATSSQRTPKPSAGWWGTVHTHTHPCKYCCANITHTHTHTHTHSPYHTTPYDYPYA